MRLIAFAYDNYEARGGLTDALTTNGMYDGDVKIFSTKDEILKHIQRHEITRDNLIIVDIDKLKTIEEDNKIK